MSLPSICVVILSLLFNTITQVRSDEKCGIQRTATLNPWLVAIKFQSPRDLSPRVKCSGALISSKDVITTAKCFNELHQGEVKRLSNSNPIRPIFNITIFADKCSRNMDDFQCLHENVLTVQVDAINIHSNYNDGWIYETEMSSAYDIAVLNLRKRVKYIDYYRPICLPSSDIAQLNSRNRELYITGFYPGTDYGKTNRNLTFYDSDTDIVLPFGAAIAGCNLNDVADDENCAVELQASTSCVSEGSLIVNKRGDHYELVGLIPRKSECFNPKLFINLYKHLDWIRQKMTGFSSSPAPSHFVCGRKKVDHTELIIRGQETKIGDWPWHATIYRLKKNSFEYICGGTLISKTVILTAAHCVTIRGETVNPEILNVILGKYNLIGRDLQSQEVEVHQVIPHEHFAPTKHFENDIALLKLRTEVTYNDYIQPACILSDKVINRLPGNSVFGTVVGWGIDQTEQMSSQLKQSNIPKVSDITCIRKNPLFYTTVLENNKKFCAGWANGTSPCNGDSGGGFLIFVPDTETDTSANAMGSWYVGGIVSLTAAIRNLGRCDPNEYVVFTDVDKYIDWIKGHL